MSPHPKHSELMDQPKYLPADEYLSGNVREKLAVARKAMEQFGNDYAPNIAALEKVQPVDLSASEISVRLGATWLPPEIVEQFMFELFSTPRYIGGKSALDFLIKVRGLTFIQAAEVILGKTAIQAPICRKRAVEKPKSLLIPERNENNDIVRRYLQDRGIHAQIIDYCIEHGMLFESRYYHNAVFLGFDTGGTARYGNVRGTYGTFKGELAGSDKHFSFSIPGRSSTVHVFESAIDAMSYATLLLLDGKDWREDSLLSLAGVFKTNRGDVVPVALDQYLRDHPKVNTLRLHLDNDEIGRGAVSGIVSGLNGRCRVLDEPPRCGKDVNDLLMYRAGKLRKESRYR